MKTRIDILFVSYFWTEMDKMEKEKNQIDIMKKNCNNGNIYSIQSQNFDTKMLKKPYESQLYEPC